MRARTRTTLSAMAVAGLLAGCGLPAGGGGGGGTDGGGGGGASCPSGDTEPTTLTIDGTNTVVGLGCVNSASDADVVTIDTGGRTGAFTIYCTATAGALQASIGGISGATPCDGTTKSTSPLTSITVTFAAQPVANVGDQYSFQVIFFP